MRVINLTDQRVDETYKGVIHAGGEPLNTPGVQPLYDGSGQETSISLGVAGQGVAITGGISSTLSISAGDVEYTSTDSVSGAGFPLVSDGGGRTSFGQIVVEALSDLTPDPTGQYTNLDYITVNSKGLVVDIARRTSQECWVNFDGRADGPMPYVIGSTTVITVTRNNHGYASGQVATVSASNSAIDGNYPITVLDSNTFTFPNPLGATGASGTMNITVRIRSSSNVSKVLRTAAGTYSVYFNDSYNNSNYITLITKGVHTPTIDAVAGYSNGDKGTILTYNQTSTFVTVSSQNGDTNNCNVYTSGSTLSATEGNPPVLYTLYNYDNYYKYRESNSGFNSGTISYETITPEYMASNKLIAVELTTSGLANCDSGRVIIDTNATITSMTDAISSSQLYINVAGGADRSYYSTRLFVYANNRLYYKHFWRGAFAIQNVNTVYDVNTPQAAEFKPPTSIAIRESITNRAGSGTTNSYITNFLNNFAFEEIKSGVVTQRLQIGRSGECNGDIYGYSVRKKFYIAQ